MTSTSSNRVVLRGLTEETAITAPTTELRSGRWTRLGADGVLGDQTTETLLQELAERARAAARAEGYAIGWAQGLREGREHASATAREEALRDAAARTTWRTEHDTAMSALRSMLDQVDGTARSAVERLGERVYDMALQVAAAVLGREVQMPGAAEDAVRRALAPLEGAIAVVIRVHPDDHALLDPNLLADRSVRLIADPSLCRGDAIAESDTALVDATVPAALDRVREVFAQ